MEKTWDAFSVEQRKQLLEAIYGKGATLFKGEEEHEFSKLPCGVRNRLERLWTVYKTRKAG